MPEPRLPTPAELRSELPVTSAHDAVTVSARRAIAGICNCSDPRLLVVVGPCSIHNEQSALAYARWLLDRQRQYADQLLLVMRCYVEKPRTNLGWPGFAHEPNLNGRSEYGEGLERSRRLLHTVVGMGMPVAVEFIEPVTALYLSDLVAWSVVGARTVESPVHRRMASGMPCPVGFKNGTSGAIKSAINAMITAREQHTQIGVDEGGHVATIRTDGTTVSHLILRGGSSGGNAGTSQIQSARDTLRAHRLNDVVMIDCGHGNADRSPAGIMATGQRVASLIESGHDGIMGVMIESNLVGGKQEFRPGCCPNPRCSITDPCLGLADTDALFHRLAEAQLAGRAAQVSLHAAAVPAAAEGAAAG